MPSLMDKGEVTRLASKVNSARFADTSVMFFFPYSIIMKRRKKNNSRHSALFFLPPDVSFTDQMSDLGSDADASRGSAEPAVKRERVEISLPLQEM